VRAIDPRVKRCRIAPRQSTKILVGEIQTDDHDEHIRKRFRHLTPPPSRPTANISRPASSPATLGRVRMPAPLIVLTAIERPLIPVEQRPCARRLGFESLDGVADRRKMAAAQADNRREVCWTVDAREILVAAIRALAVAGERERHGHPHAETIDMLSRLHI